MNSKLSIQNTAAKPLTTRRDLFHSLSNLMAAIGTTWIFALMLLIVADVIGRNFLNKPITGVAEFAARSVAAIVFLQLAAAIMAGKMTRSDFLLRLLLRWSPRAVSLLEVAFAIVGSFLFAALAYISWPELLQAWTINEFFGVQGVFTLPTWPFRALMVIGSAMASVAYLMTIPGLLQLQSFSQGESL